MEGESLSLVVSLLLSPLGYKPTVSQEVMANLGGLKYKMNRNKHERELGNVGKSDGEREGGR